MDFRNKLECLSLAAKSNVCGRVWKGLPGKNTLAYYGNPFKIEQFDQPFELSLHEDWTKNMTIVEIHEQF